MKNTTNLDEVNKRKIADADNRRDLFYTTAKPTVKPAVGEDARMLHVDLKRSKLFAPEIIIDALAAYDKEETSDTVGGLRNALRKTIVENVALAYLLSTPALQDLRDRLMILSEEPSETSGSFKVVICMFFLASVPIYAIVSNEQAEHNV
jgi:hypothetical protein